MPKRKRNSDADNACPSSPTGPDALTIITTRLTTTITQGATQLKKALTLARGFERQKLGRRQKAANHEPHALLKLREEVIVLKGLDLGVVAERQLLRRLGRVKRVVESQPWRGIYGGRKADSAKGEAEGRVVGRLMGSAAVKECADGIVGRVMDALGLEAMVAGKMKGRLKEIDVNGQEVKIARGRASELTRADGDEWSGSEIEEGEGVCSAGGLDAGNDIELQNSTRHDPDASANDTDASSDFSGFSARIASSSAESEASSSKVEVSEEQSRAGRQMPNSHQKPSATPKTRPKTSMPIPAPPSSTAFLPSLMMGGYYSGSESASEIDDVDTKPRKNRRGQRERQKIAEAKYGSRAKHIAKQNSSSNRNVGWDARKGATTTAKDANGKFNGQGRMRIGRPGGASASGNGNGNVNTNGGSKAPTGANGDVMGAGRKNPVKDNGGAMHPSWEAARKRKEQGSKISINTGNGGGCIGTKILFD
jgi:hypothetical protein